MLINLVGPIASGKSSFAKWFLEKHPQTLHLDIAYFREIYDTDKCAWKMIEEVAALTNNCLIESTGLHYRIQNLWTPRVVKRGIYTIKFMSNRSLLNERIKKRSKDNLVRLNDEMLENEIFSDIYNELPANLNVWMADNSIYQTIEKYILNAKRRIERRTRK